MYLTRSFAWVGRQRGADPSEAFIARADDAPCELNSERSSSLEPLAASEGVETGVRALLRTKEVWAICVAQYTQSWGMYILLNYLPSFFSEVYNVPTADLGNYTVLPSVLQGVVGVSAGALAGAVYPTFLTFSSLVLAKNPRLVKQHRRRRNMLHLLYN